MTRLISSGIVVSLLGALLISGFANSCFAVPLALQIDKIPADGLVVREISLGLVRSELEGRPLDSIGVTVKADGRKLAAQLVPRPGFGRDNFDATLLLQAPGRTQLKASLELTWDGAAPKPVTGAMTVSTSAAQWKFDSQQAGPLPLSLTFRASQRTVPFSFNDRLIDYRINAYPVGDDKQTRLEILAAGPVATVVRGQARYLAAGKPAAGEPGIVYDWYFFHHSPFVFVNAKQFSKQAYRWKEMHFLEWTFKNGPFKKLLGDGAGADLTDKGRDQRFRQWAALSSEGLAVAALAGPVISYDASSSYGSYLHVAAPEPWAGWDGFSRNMKAWLWAGETEQAETILPAASAARATVTVLRPGSPAMTTQVAALSAQAQKLTGSARSLRLWKIALAERAVRAGKLPSSALGSLRLPRDWHTFVSGSLGLIAEVRPDGMRIVSLYDLQRGRELMASRSLPLFALQAHSPDPADGEARLFGAHENWDDCRIVQQGSGFRLTFIRGELSRPLLKVVVNAEADVAHSGWRWKMTIDNQRAAFAIQNVDFPQITVASQGNGDASFYPRAAGVVQQAPVGKNFRASATYPSGYCTMQFMAVYSTRPGAGGLYVARHDPKAAIKQVSMAADSEAGGLQMTFNEIAENPLSAGNGFTLSGEGVWQLLHGDWYDAARIYRGWAAREASWWPALTNEGRADTPLWYRQLDAWACLQMLPDKVIQEARQIRQFLGVPIGVHWYHWNTGSFDNDYPHFEARDGFKESVAALQKEGIHIMPYTNGRLWDTRDRGLEDWEFTSKGLPNAVKEYKEGKLALDLSSYNAREKDGSKTVLATMCPYMPLWQDTMAALASKLSNGEGVDGLYYDQISVSVPIPCMDATHRHPLGGGHWWVDGYHRMLEKIRAARRPGSIVTSEAMAEAYIKYFDGYLTYSSSSDGQVPAFSAVYGGAIQLIGREYEAGEADMNKSLPMKAGQELVFGEQIGWLTHDILFNKINDTSRAYYKQLVQIRHKINPYFYAGEMQRPPKLNGVVPTITADWGPSSTPDWSQGGQVTTDAVLTGAWKKRGENKCVLIFTNVTDKPVKTSFTLDPSRSGVTGIEYRVARWSGSQLTPKVTSESGIRTHAISVPGHSILIWEVSAE